MVYKNKIPNSEAIALGQRLDALRLRAGLTKTQLSIRMGFSHPSKVTRLINGEESLDSYDLRQRLLLVLKATMDELDGLTPIKPRRALKTTIAVLIAASMVLTCTTGCTKKKLALVPVSITTVASRR